MAAQISSSPWATLGHGDAEEPAAKAKPFWALAPAPGASAGPDPGSAGQAREPGSARFSLISIAVTQRPKCPAGSTPGSG